MKSVYLIQENPSFNFMPARKFGNIIPLLPSSMQLSYISDDLIDSLRNKLANFSSEDYILAVGDPILIGIVSAIVSEKTNGEFKMLKWDRIEKDYFSFNININD